MMRERRQRPPRIEYRYRIVEGDIHVVEDGKLMGICYDYLEPGEAELICGILNRGIGPDWDSVSKEIERLKANTKTPAGDAAPAGGSDGEQ